MSGMIKHVLFILFYNSLTQAIRERAKKAAATRKPHSVSASTKQRQAETTIGASTPMSVSVVRPIATGDSGAITGSSAGPNSHVADPLTRARLEQDKATDQGSASQVKPLHPFGSVRLG